MTKEQIIEKLNQKYNDILKSDIEINVENGVVTLR